MDLGLGSTGSYSLRAVLYLAGEYGKGRRKTREIAEALGVPDANLSLLLSNLVHHGILTAAAGRYGGYAFARPPAELSLLDVIEVTEGRVHAETCLLDGTGPPHANCPVHDVWARARDSLVSTLDATTLADIVQERKAPVSAR
ncbi:MAG: Rrf2 family transcriptional regulator [Dehalococcoidia bacterium]|nr:Rrf2 family transcriptional regulator [Dehalococcoidia bacterium]